MGRPHTAQDLSRILRTASPYDGGASAGALMGSVHAQGQVRVADLSGPSRVFTYDTMVPARAGMLLRDCQFLAAKANSEVRVQLAGGVSAIMVVHQSLEPVYLWFTPTWRPYTTFGRGP
jgi:hypothetical protein